MFINTGCLAAWTRRVVPTLKDITDKVISVAMANTYKIPVAVDTERGGPRARYTFFMNWYTVVNTVTTDDLVTVM